MEEVTLDSLQILKHMKLYHNKICLLLIRFEFNGCRGIQVICRALSLFRQCQQQK